MNVKYKTFLDALEEYTEYRTFLFYGDNFGKIEYLIMMLKKVLQKNFTINEVNFSSEFLQDKKFIDINLTVKISDSI